MQSLFVSRKSGDNSITCPLPFPALKPLFQVGFKYITSNYCKENQYESIV